MMLTDAELLRYSRQILLPGWDIAAQERVRAARVLIVGLGGLGCPAAQTLAAAGVGTLVLCDFDVVELSNLQRQCLHHEADIGRLKVDSAADKLAAINPLVTLLREPHPVDADLLAGWLPEVDLVLDCCDNFATRDEVARLCWQARIPLVSAAALGWDGQLAVYDARAAGTACYRCVFPAADEDAPACADAGVMASTVAVMGSWQAQEALKLLAGVGEPLRGQLLLWQGSNNSVRRVRTSQDPACPVCGNQGVISA